MWSDDAWTNRRKWYESEDQYVRRQREESEQRSAEAEGRLRASLRQVSEQKEVLARQVADLGAAFDAFVELTSVRGELTRYTAAAEARDGARALLARLRSSGFSDSPPSQTTATGDDGSGSSSGLLDADAVPGYWLPAAAAGLDALVRGDKQAGDAALAVAADSDEQRTALFVALALPLVGKPDLAVPWLPRALGPAPASSESQVAAAVREVWLLAGRGGYGEDGRAAAVHWLTGAQTPASVDQLYAMIGERVGLSSTASELSARLAHARAAGDALAELGKRFSDEPMPAGPGSAAEPTDLVQTEAAPSLTLLEALIAEGSAQESTLILRAQQLAAEVRRLRAHQDTEPAARWDAPSGALLTLLDADLRSGSADLAGLRSIAQAALRQTAAGLAERLLAEASSEPPTGFVLRLDGMNVEIAPAKPLDPQMAELDAAVERRYAPEPGRSGRKQAAEAALKIAQRKDKNRRDAEAAIERFTTLCGQFPELQEAARQKYTALLDHLGQLAEREYVQ